MSKITKSNISIIILLIAYPIGLVVMWLIAPWSKGLKIFLTLLLFLPIFLFVILGLRSTNQKMSLVNAPQTSTETFKDDTYPLTFNYPSNWIMKTYTLPQDILNSRTQTEPISTAYKSITISDTPTSNNYAKQPICKFEITIYNNPQKLSLDAWNSKSIDEGTTPPSTEEEKDAEKILKKTTPAKINNLDAVQILGGSYLISNNNYIYKIETENDLECSDGYKAVLDSVNFQ